LRVGRLRTRAWNMEACYTYHRNVPLNGREALTTPATLRNVQSQQGIALVGS
jgi:hypothetical protein